MRRAVMIVLATTGVLIVACLPAAAARTKLHTKHFSAVESGVMLQQQRPALRGRLPDQALARRDRCRGARRELRRDGVSGQRSRPVISSFKDGRQTATETFTLGHAAAWTGSARSPATASAPAGPGQHQQERCAYTLTGTYDLTDHTFSSRSERHRLSPLTRIRSRHVDRHP